MMDDDKQSELEQALAQLYNLFGGNVIVTMQVSGKGLALLKVVNERYRSIDDEDDEDNDMPPPLKVGVTSLRDRRPHYFG